ncbi:hypothetical protein LOZ66_001868 [Ophidiomyces ophidiicola]|nr:hypothetical protein LOZ66_001868 [Ophidiomyces ophidiicola]
MDYFCDICGVVDNIQYEYEPYKTLPREPDHEETVEIVCEADPQVHPGDVDILLGQVITPQTGVFMSTTQAMAAMENWSRPENFLRSNARATERLYRKLYFDQDFQRLPVRIIVLAIFKIMDRIFFARALWTHVRIGLGNNLGSINALGETKCGIYPLEIQLSSSDLNCNRKIKSIKRRVDLIVEVLIHEMCHAYLPVTTGRLGHPDIDEYGGKIRDGHGVYFGSLMGFCQKMLDTVGWRVDLSVKGRFRVYQSSSPEWSLRELQTSRRTSIRAW